MFSVESSPFDQYNSQNIGRVAAAAFLALHPCVRESEQQPQQPATLGQAASGGAKDCSSLVCAQLLVHLVQVWNYARGAATASSGVGPRAAAESCT